MDGNGRWARRRGHPASFGHRAGVRAIKRALEGCEELGVRVLSVYAFSTENWSRPRAEVRALMRLFHETMQREIDEMHRRGVRIVVSGRRDELSRKMRERIDEAAIAGRLYVPELPDPDLIIRTAGERRVSNFLLWQSAYSEMLVTETLWPDFGIEDLKAAIADYSSRVRNFGGRPEDSAAAAQ